MRTATKSAPTGPVIPADCTPEQYLRLMADHLGATPEGLADPRHGPWQSSVPWKFTTDMPADVAELEAEHAKLTEEAAAIDSLVDQAIRSREMDRASVLRQRQKLLPEMLSAVGMQLLRARTAWHAETITPIIEHERQLTLLQTHHRRLVRQAQAQLRDLDMALSHFTVQRHRYEDQVMANDRRLARLIDPTPTLFEVVEAAVLREAADTTPPAPPQLVTLDRNHPASIEARAKAERQRAAS